MANVLGELFQDIADAIRGKTGEVALLKPNEFAAAIDSIVVGSGDSSGGTIVDGAGNVKFASGRFDTTTAGVYRQTIEHGLGEIPDFVAVFACNMGADASDYAVEDYRLASIYGASSDYSSKLRGYSAFVNGRGTNANGDKVDGLSWSSIDKEQSDLYSYWHIIQCPNADTFTVGWNDNYSSTATGQYLFLPNTVYRWVAISGIGSVAASDDVRYVTFMNGDTVLYKKAVATGDDCVDVLTKGLIETPTKESDAQYDYTFYGWGAEDGGAADDTILQNITEDKTVYAIFAATLRTYTITYLDEDGTTVLNTETLAYGAMPSYVGSKEGYNFDGWEPELAVVTGDASYIAQFSETITFAGASWADIARISEAGEAASYFAIGDTKTVTFDGNSLEVIIAGFDHDDLADGSGKAGISIVATQLTQTTHTWTTRYDLGEYSTISDLKSKFTDAGLADAIKSVTKQCDSSIYSGTSNVTKNVDVDVWVPSAIELAPRTDALYNFTYKTTSYITNHGSTYAAFANVADVSKKVAGTNEYATYWTRTIYRAGAWSPVGNLAENYTHTWFTNAYNSGKAKTQHMLLGFCI